MRRSSNSQETRRGNSANVAEIKAQFSRFLRQVRDGETVTVTNRDRPVARLVPVAEEQETLRLQKPSKDPSGLASLLDLPPVKRRRTDSLKLILEERRKR